MNHMKIKVLIFMQQMSGGGAERTIVNILNHLDRNKFEVIFVLGNDKVNAYSSFFNKEISIIGLNAPRLRYSFFKLRSIIIRERPDVVFTTLYTNILLAGLVNLTLGKRIPLVIREANLRSASEEFPKFSRLLTWAVYNYLADAVVAISEGIRSDLIQNFHIRSRKIIMIYNLLDIDLIHKMMSEEIKGPVWNNNVKNIIAVGRLDKQKDYPTLLKALQIVVSRYPAKLIVLGQGSLEPMLRKLSSDMGIDDQIEWKGFVFNPYQYMYHSDVFVLTSSYEGFANVIAEALACGVPVISTDCKSGPCEILKGGVYGRLAAVGDYQQIAEEILSLLGSDNKEVIARGLERAQDFDADRMILEYEDLFLELAKKR